MSAASLFMFKALAAEFLHKLSKLSSAPPTLLHPQYDTLFHRKMSEESQEEKRRRKAVVSLLKITLVKFSRSQRLAAQTRLASAGSRRVKRDKSGEQRGEEKMVCWGGGSRNTENEQISQARLAQGAQCVLESFANRSLFFIAEMKAA